MPSIWERPTSRPFTVDATTEGIARQYFVTGTTDENEVYELAVNTSPITLGRMVRSRIKAEPAGGNHWFVEVEYSSGSGTGAEANNAVGVEPVEPIAPGLNEPLGGNFSFDTSAQTLHITQAISTLHRRVPADGAGAGVGTGGDEKLAIGLTKDRVEGVDIYAPAFQFSTTVARGSVTLNYINSALYGLVGKTNNAPFYTFATGEVLYMGCTGNFTMKDRWSVTHKFACSPEELNIAVGNGITVPRKRGWEYLWVGYEPAQVGNRLLQVPATAYVQQVYKSGNFALLEIGT